MAITKNVKAEKLTKPAYLLDEVDNAFQRFQSADTLTNSTPENGLMSQNPYARGNLVLNAIPIT